LETPCVLLGESVQSLKFRIGQPHGPGLGPLPGQIAGNDPWIISAQGATHTGPKHHRQGMGSQILHKGLIGTGADVHGDIPLGQKVENLRIRSGRYRMDDAFNPAMEDCLAYILAGAVLPRMGCDAKAAGPCPLEYRCPVTKGNPFKAPCGKPHDESRKTLFHQVQHFVAMLGPK